MRPLIVPFADAESLRSKMAATSTIPARANGKIRAM
jgi:hypothetical protein